MLKIKRYSPVLLISLLMTVMILYSVKVQLDSPFDWVTFRDPVSGTELKPYYHFGNQKYLLVIPSYLSPDEVIIELPPKGFNLHFWDYTQKYGSTLDTVPLKEDIYITVGFLRWGWTHTIQVWNNRAVPTIQIQAHDGLEEQLYQDKSYKADVFTRFIEPDGSITISTVAQIEARGNSTWQHEKMPYNLTFDTGISYGDFQDVNKLCLLAEYSDESKLRNSIGYFLGRHSEVKYASPYMYADLYVNGEYKGLYALTTKDEYRKHIETDGIQSVFVYRGIWGREDFYINRPYTVVYGDVEKTKQAVAELDEAMKSQNWARTRELADIDSFARRYALEELLANSDILTGSQYFYLDTEGIIHCMLPWDYDRTIGFDDDFFNNKQIYEIVGCHHKEGWYIDLLKDPQFVAQVRSVLNDVYTEELFQKLSEYTQDNIDRIAESRESDIARWNHLRQFSQYDNSAHLSSFSDFGTLFDSYFPARKVYLMDYFADPSAYCLVSFTGPFHKNVCVPKGALLSDYLEGANMLTMQGNRPDLLGWFTEDGLTPEDITVVTEDILFTAQFAIQTEE